MTLEELTDEMKPFHNHLCIIYDTEIVRLIGVAEDDDDLYYVVDRMTTSHLWYSAVGHCYSLKVLLPPDDYDRMNNIFRLNTAPETDSFLVITK